MGKLYRLVFGALFIISIGFFNFSAQAQEKITDKIPEIKSPDYSEEYLGKDRLESFNRLMFRVNTLSNDYVIYPANVVWASVMPKYGMDRINNMFDNLAYPKRLASSLFQADFGASGTESLRFLTNTTLGFAGMYDPAKNWFGLEPRNESFGQTFAAWGIGKGYYLYLPFVGPTTVRNGVGSVFDTAFKPESYIPFAPVALAVKGTKVMDKTTQLQSKLEYINSTYADPYEITRLYYGFNTYTLEKNLDRKEVFDEVDSRMSVNSEPDGCITGSGCKISDIKFEDFDSQGAVVDSIRSSVVDRQKKEESFWADISLWNRTFEKRIEDKRVRLHKDADKYEYRYLLQKDKTSPLAIIYPAIGENTDSKQSIALSRILYDKGYSVLFMGSTFDWKFARSMPHSYKPGLTTADAEYLRNATLKILKDLSRCQNREFKEKIIVGTSLGATHTLFIAAMEEKDPQLGISRYISISPPVDLLHATQTLDKFIESWKQTNNQDLKLKTALSANKIIKTCRKKYDCDGDISLPLREGEAKLAISFVAKQKLTDLILTIERNSKINKSELYNEILKMNFNDYLNKYILPNEEVSAKDLESKSSLYSIAENINNNPNIRIIFSEDDYLLTDEHTKWLKDTFKDRSVIFSHGSHLGFLYRKEFQDLFTEAINIRPETCKKAVSTCNKK